MSIYICDLCFDLMENAQQLLCGCRFCSFCIKSYISTDKQTCPSCNSSNIQTIFNDKAFQKIIERLQSCPLNCGNKDNVRKHVKICPKRACSDQFFHKHALFLMDSIKQLTHEIQHLKDENKDIRQQLNAFKTIPKQLNTIERIPKQLPHAIIKDDKVSVSNGVATWIIPNITMKIEQKDRLNNILSDAFYLSPNGYCFRLKAYPYGDAAAYGNSLSIYFLICKGQNDNSLKWPFTDKTVLSMLGCTQNKDKVYKFIPQDNITCYGKPELGDNIASGAPYFIKHVELLNSGTFIIVNTIRITFKLSL